MVLLEPLELKEQRAQKDKMAPLVLLAPSAQRATKEQGEYKEQRGLLELLEEEEQKALAVEQDHLEQQDLRENWALQELLVELVGLDLLVP